MSEIFNIDKLPEYHGTFKDKKVCIVGSGAVGSYLGEMAAKMGSGIITANDFDVYEMGNISKSSGIVRMPEDIGFKKAKVVADRVKPLMVKEGHSNSIDGEIMRLGPMAFAAYDVVFLALDNFAAKIYFNQVWLQIPVKERPVLIFGGTNLEAATATCLDGDKLCLRCCCDESWLVKSNLKTSCSGPQYRLHQGKQQIVRTSGLASSIAANLMCEQYRAYVVGMKDKVINTESIYSAYPMIDLSRTNPRKRENCPDCKRYHPPKELIALDGNSRDMPLGQCLKKISTYLGDDDYYLKTHFVEYGNVGYSGLITSDYCRCCGDLIEDFNVHESRVDSAEIRCSKCNNRNDIHVNLDKKGEVIYAIRPDEMNQTLLSKAIYDLGWPIGGYLQVVKMNGAKDFLDDGIEELTFYLVGDKELVFGDLSL